MNALKILFGSLIMLLLGALIGVKVVDNNQSIYANLDMGSIGEFTIGKQVDLTHLSSLHDTDKALLISGLKELNAEDKISRAIVDLAQTGQAMFLPKQFKVMLHITEDRNLPPLVAATCKDPESPYEKVVYIYDGRENQAIKGMLRVGVWNTVDHASCFNGDYTHVWVHPETAKLLYPPEEEVNLLPSTNIELVGRVSDSCKLEVESMEGI